MVLWIIFAVMTAAAVIAVLWPFGRKPTLLHGGSDRLVYRDQLQEIDRDHTAGLIGEAEADSARVEISRRLLAAADEEAAAASKPPASPYNVLRRRAAAATAIVVVPAVALGLYLKLGSPDVPGQSAFARSNGAPGDQSIASLVSQVEEHLARNPNDGAGWEVIAPVYLRLGRFDDAVVARKKAIALNGDSAARESALGEALVAAADGVVTDDAKVAFQHAIAGDARDAKARYFLGLAEEQDGDRDAAAVKWRALLKDAPPDAPWIGLVGAALARVTGVPVASADPTGGPVASRGPTGGDVAAASTMTEAQRTDMVRGMVQRLADRLHANGNDIEGWLRLVRAYAILGDRDKAKDAAADARRALSDHSDDVKRIDELAKDLGLEG
jgi:cytochrome c-type biogenesis protein CcmH